MTVTINGTTGIANDSGYTGDGINFADSTPANTLVTTRSEEHTSELQSH